MSSQVCRNCDHQLSDGKYLCDPADANACGPCQNLAELEVKIKQTKMMLADFVNEHRRLKEEANDNHDRLTDRLPPEITGYIFQLCTPQDAMEIDLRNVQLSTIRAPFILSTVCRRWRAIALSTPQLWNTLLLYLQSSNSRTSPIITGGVPFVQKWIDRAGVLPLSISVCASITDLHEPALEIIDLLNRYADRWLQLKYDGTPTWLYRFLSNRNELAQLHTLHINANYESRFVSHTLNIYPKRLIKLSIIGIRLAVIKFDWRHLIQLEIGKVPPAECFEALRRAPHLTNYTVRWAPKGRAQHEEYFLPYDPIVQPNIHYLEFIQTHMYIRALWLLSCPSLTTLVLTFTRQPVEMDLIVTFLERSGCSLERLSLLNANIGFTNDLMKMYEGIPTLQHLHMEFRSDYPSPTSSNIFAPLAEFSIVDGQKEARYLPALRSLTLKTDAIDDWTLVLSIFGTPTAHSSTGLECHRHALEDVAICLTTTFDLDLASTIGEETLERIVHLGEAGVKWKIQCQEDIIEVNGS
ncbi:hypothetical protein BJ912DRAFT_1040526 [Pholiota molesta]|nr:hypothetical protein BJ912DRAFT_1040526 [Pholiota molesta]